LLKEVVEVHDEYALSPVPFSITSANKAAELLPSEYDVASARRDGGSREVLMDIDCAARLKRAAVERGGRACRDAGGGCCRHVVVHVGLDVDVGNGDAGDVGLSA
jgi:hypothetical protein